MPTALVNGVRLNYLQIEEPDGRSREDLVMVHGLATNLAFWYLKYAPVFARRFRVTLLDLRGHGRSEMPAAGYSPANLARDLAALLDHLQIEKAHFLAHSFGGVVTMSFACEQPHRVRSLALADSHISAVRHAAMPEEWRYGRQLQPVVDRHRLNLDTQDPYFGIRLLTRVAQWRLKGDELPAELSELVSPLIGNNGLRTAAQWNSLMESTSAGAEIIEDDGLTLERLRTFRFPILALYGDNSQARLTGARLLDVWPHAEFRRMRAAGHFFPASRPEEVISCCERFWSGELPDAARTQRAGEARRSYFRSDRLFSAEGVWYVATREHNQVGPFAAREHARDALTRLISVMQA